MSKAKLKHNTTMIERNVRGSITTGLKMMDNIKKMSRNRYYRTARKYFPNKSNRRFTRGKRKRGGSGKGKGMKRLGPQTWDDVDVHDDGGVHNLTSSSSSKSKLFNVIGEFIKQRFEVIYEFYKLENNGDIQKLDDEFNEFEKTPKYRKLIHENDMNKIEGSIHKFFSKYKIHHSPTKRP